MIGCSMGPSMSRGAVFAPILGCSVILICNADQMSTVIAGVARDLFKSCLKGCSRTPDSRTKTIVGSLMTHKRVNILSLLCTVTCALCNQYLWRCWVLFLSLDSSWNLGGMRQCRRIQQDIIMFNATISACEKGQQWERALAVLEDARPAITSLLFISIYIYYL